MTINELIKNNLQKPTNTYGDILLNENQDININRLLSAEEKEQYKQIKQSDLNRLYYNENMIAEQQDNKQYNRMNKNQNKQQVINITGIGEVIQLL